MADQISSAVQVALSPSSSAAQRAEAYTFLEQVKNTAAQTWTECYRLFLAREQFGPEARLFALQVMDEADRLLDMDFGPIIDKILKVIPRERTTYLFSATMTTKVQKLQRASLSNPVRVEVSEK